VSAAIRAALTLPALAGLSARVEERTIMAAMTHKAINAGIFSDVTEDSFGTVTLFSQLFVIAARKTLTTDLRGFARITF
jgi:hypothetical protein